MMLRSCLSLTRRHLSSSPARPLSPPPPPVSLQSIRSRRKVQRPRTAQPAPPKPKEDERPWPDSVRYMGYAAVTFLVPYSILWALYEHRSWRETVLPPWMLEHEWLRRHFGVEDPWSVPYVDVLVDGATDPHRIPVRLPEEADAATEATQASIDEQLRGSEQVRLMAIENGMVVEEVIATLPASLLANRQTLSEHGPKAASLAIDFVTPETSEWTQESTGALDESPPSIMDPLLALIHTYSSWYYQSPAVVEAKTATHVSTANHVTASVTNEEAQLQHLEADLNRLQAELRNPASTRPMYDIEEDIAKTKATIRRLRWRRWVPWSS